jgi:hypothetical protein
MARIELRDCDVILQDGLSGTAAINEPVTAPVATDTDFDIDTIVLNTADTDLVPLGARFTVAGETIATTVHTVTARTPTATSPTTNIVFTPALGAGTYVDGRVVTFLPQELEIKIGDGNITYTEHNEFMYDLDRGDLDTVREGNQVPMDVKLDAVFEHITQGTTEVISPMDALKGIGGADEWVSSSADPCEPYCIDLIVRHTPPCGTAQVETMTFPDFRSESREINYKDATISITGKCKVVEPSVVRSDAA